MESAATSILKRAVELDRKQQYTLAMTLYQEGIQILLNALKEQKNVTSKTDLSKNPLALKVNEYLEKAERVKKLIETKKADGTYREVIKIEDGSTGHSYATVFGRFLDNNITYVYVEDPYIRSFHQCQNMVRLCELLVQKCSSLSRISLLTTCDPEDSFNQLARLNELKDSLNSQNIDFNISFSETLHDRQITLSNGWIIKIGRGLSYFKAPQGKFVLGSCDLELRPCLETTVDVFHKNQLRNVTR
ncbi:MIT domain-containing protein 1-like [Pseudomyrmex gracilis]|uniref:MIT domain-containing protein 1-like n=1 Tax=Pseudomyrmex gracilis TaxID=219809 RepID=UPI000995B5BD|nr:MIT domain-containing protein 1-like [Pseudomyrmex gracilis]XP_020285260.1 MIT domain-containing protein 1-like [Pseudomyrmex gracilis]